MRELTENCPKCGGRNAPVPPERYNPTLPWIMQPLQAYAGERICMCPLEPAVKHDDRMVFRYGEREFIVRTEQGNFVLSPVDALALLEELELQRETLERLASEQKGQER